MFSQNIQRACNESMARLSPKSLAEIVNDMTNIVNKYARIRKRSSIPEIKQHLQIENACRPNSSYTVYEGEIQKKFISLRFNEQANKNLIAYMLALSAFCYGKLHVGLQNVKAMTRYYSFMREFLPHHMDGGYSDHPSDEEHNLSGFFYRELSRIVPQEELDRIKGKAHRKQCGFLLLRFHIAQINSFTDLLNFSDILALMQPSFSIKQKREFSNTFAKMAEKLALYLANPLLKLNEMKKFRLSVEETYSHYLLSTGYSRALRAINHHYVTSAMQGDFLNYFGRDLPYLIENNGENDWDKGNPWLNSTRQVFSTCEDGNISRFLSCFAIAMFFNNEGCRALFRVSTRRLDDNESPENLYAIFFGLLEDPLKYLDILKAIPLPADRQVERVKAENALYRLVGIKTPLESRVIALHGFFSTPSVPCNMPRPLLQIIAEYAEDASGIMEVTPEEKSNLLDDEAKYSGVTYVSSSSSRVAAAPDSLDDENSDSETPYVSSSSSRPGGAGGRR
jgi:hypothetical protein